MKTFISFDGTEIAYEQWDAESEAPWVVLHHGFAVSTQLNWVVPGIVSAIVAAGRRVIAIDARGHGRSGKPADPQRYGEANMVRDLRVLFDLVGEPQVDLVGYSMGSVVCLLAASQDKRVRRLAVGGVGEGVLACGGIDRRVLDPQVLIGALLGDGNVVEDKTARLLRTIAEISGADRQALADHCKVVHDRPIDLRSIKAKTLVLVGDADPLAVKPELLAGEIRNATLRYVSGDHQTAVLAPAFVESLVAFLGN